MRAKASLHLQPLIYLPGHLTPASPMPNYECLHTAPPPTGSPTRAPSKAPTTIPTTPTRAPTRLPTLAGGATSAPTSSPPPTHSPTTLPPTPAPTPLPTPAPSPLPTVGGVIEADTYSVTLTVQLTGVTGDDIRANVDTLRQLVAGQCSCGIPQVRYKKLSME